MIMGIVTTTAAAAFAAVCAYLDFKWVTRILDMLEDQEVDQGANAEP